MSIRKLAISWALILLTFLSITTTYMLWEDGRQFVEAEIVHLGYADEVANPSYLDHEQLHSKSAAVWKQYMQTQYDVVLRELAGSKSP